MFSYDSVGRLVNACDSTGSLCKNTVNLGTSGNAWAYDSAGNRDQVGVTNEDYGPGNRLVAFGTTNYLHDLVGQITCRIIGTCPSGTGTGYKYQWDAAGRLRSIRNGSTGALIDSLFYDARGRRVRKQMASSDEYYVYEGNQVIFDVDGAGTFKREYAWYPGGIDLLLALRTSTDTLAALLDPITGTVRGLAKFRNGARVKEYDEAPWGDAVADTGLVVRYRFAGREWDQESGLYYMRARYYDPALGRWISEDPIGLAGGANLFAYAGGDPVNRRDPSGLGDECVLHIEYWGTYTDEHGHEGFVFVWWKECHESGGSPTGPGDPTGVSKAAGEAAPTHRLGSAPKCSELANDPVVGPNAERVWQRTFDSQREAMAWAWQTANGYVVGQVETLGSVHGLSPAWHFYGDSQPRPPVGVAGLLHGHTYGLPMSTPDTIFANHWQMWIGSVTSDSMSLFVPGTGGGIESCARK